MSQKNIELWIKFALSRTDRTIFESLLDKFQTNYEKSADTIQKLQKKTTKSKGTGFETFCKMWLKAKNYPQVYLLKEVPQDILDVLNLPRNDLGIDLIAIDSNGGYYAIQSKYKLGSKYRANKVSWKELSTFHDLCSRTGPYLRRITMTNCVGVRHIGDKDEKDQTIAFNTFNNADRAFWLKMIGSEGHRLGDGSEAGVEIIIENKIENKTDAIIENKVQVMPKIKLNIVPTGTVPIINNASTTTLRELRSQYYRKKLTE